MIRVASMLLRRLEKSHSIMSLSQRQLHKSVPCLKKGPKNLKGKNSSSQRWIVRQLSDPYVQKAAAENYRCRSAYKLIEIDEKFRFLKPGLVVVDCGACPGSWTQVAVNRVNAAEGFPRGMVVGVDLQYMSAIKGAKLLSNCDFTLEETQEHIQKYLPNGKADVVLSDMAPNATGLSSLDHDQIVSLQISAFKFSKVVLREGGVFVSKLWDGSHCKMFQSVVGDVFKFVKVVKPQSSRSNSAELFVFARGYKRIKQDS
ncbi:MRM2 [Branchiostoma lanceolatum]|uniref:rRNA methyltransferase 2, mitochondrial n=1 Tax=Branchiostoma lanceolatum TaxID=7740 RepID=A0A8K0AG67_BRALA|nr:MRM2 [Branchiostoma lanceolatum]